MADPRPSAGFMQKIHVLKNVMSIRSQCHGQVFGSYDPCNFQSGIRVHLQLLIPSHAHDGFIKLILIGWTQRLELDRRPFAVQFVELRRPTVADLANNVIAIFPRDPNIVSNYLEATPPAGCVTLDIVSRLEVETTFCLAL